MAATLASALVNLAGRVGAPRRTDRFGNGARPGLRGRNVISKASSDADDAMKDEKAGAAMRDKESKQAGVDGKRAPRGGDPPPTGGGWEWTLNWDPIVFDNNNVTIENPTKEKLDDAKLIIGSCPRSPADVDRLIDEAGVEAIICLQCTLCHGAMKIDWEPIKQRALERGVLIGTALGLSQP
jgi:hypothetical protein|tara:strand:- start:611 stop:1156 length:546 start_codon:yes stop_codon:yes gene_type:complete